VRRRGRRERYICHQQHIEAEAVEDAEGEDPEAVVAVVAAAEHDAVRFRH
jgi:hypothetical protein